MAWRKQLTESLIYRAALRYLCVCVCVCPMSAAIIAHNGILSMPKVSPMNKVV